jgi:hypothetical protein
MHEALGWIPSIVKKIYLLQTEIKKVVTRGCEEWGKESFDQIMQSFA